MPALTNQNALKLGYVPLIDSAPILVAEHLGYFEEAGVEVSLSEEVGWATVRDKLIHGELDAASTLIGLPYALHNGVGCYETKMSIPLIISANGNVISLTKEISKEQLNNDDEVSRILNERAAKYNRKWTFATVSRYSAHLILLFQWLNKYLKNHIAEIELVFIPPQLAPDLLAQGMIDGFCTGEPWGSLSEKTGAGHIVATSYDCSASHPEKVLSVPQRTLQHQEGNVVAMGNAIKKACAFCNAPENIDTLAEILSQRPALKASPDDIKECLTKRYANSCGELHPLHKFSGEDINNPSAEKEKWVLQGLKEAGLFRKKIIDTGQIMNPDLLFK